MLINIIDSYDITHLKYHHYLPTVGTEALVCRRYRIDDVCDLSEYCDHHMYQSIENLDYDSLYVLDDDIHLA